VHHLQEEIVYFIENTYGSTNDLMKIVLLDAKDPWCRAAALASVKLGKAITSPLWRLMEDKKIHMSEMSQYYTDLLMFMSDVDEQSLRKFLVGDSLPPLLQPYFHQDDMWSVIFQQNELDDLVLQILKNVFLDWSEMMQRLVSDHLLSGKYHTWTRKCQRKLKVLQSTTNCVKNCLDIMTG
jgi:hypothetical protein